MLGFLLKIKPRFRLFPYVVQKIHGVPVRRETLQFQDKRVEVHYRETHFYETKKHLRKALLFSVFIFLLLGIVDYHIFPNGHLWMWAVRLTSFTPFALFLVLLSYTKNWRVVQPAAAFAMLIAGVTSVLLVVDNATYLGSVYYIGMILFLFYGYSVLRVHFIWMVRAGLAMVLFYELVALFVVQIPPSAFLINNVFLIFANAIGVFSSYTIEYFSRKDFVQNVLFMKSADSLALSLSERDRHIRNFIMGARDVVLFQLSLEDKEDSVLEVDHVSPALSTLIQIGEREARDIRNWFVSYPRRKDFIKGLTEAVRDENRWDKEIRLLTKKSEQEKWFRFLVLSGKATRYSKKRALGIMLDITEEKVFQKKQEGLLRQKNNFLNVLAHQLNTPLNVIKWGVEVLGDREVGDLKDDQRKLLSSIKSASDGMVLTVQDLFTSLAIIDKQDIFLDKKFVSLSDVILPVLETLKPRLKRIQFIFEYEKINKSKLGVFGDIDKLQLIIRKMLENAIDYSEDKETVRLSAEKDKDGNIKIVITGGKIRLSKEEKKHIFDFFFRGKDAMKKKPNQSGVGLSLAKHYAVLHGGDVLFEETEKQQASVVVLLPISYPDRDKMKIL